MDTVVATLKQEKLRLENELERIESAIKALTENTQARSHISAAGRKRISEVMKKRWARDRTGQRRHISAAGKKKLSDTMKKRWAEFRSKKSKAANRAA